MAPERTIDHEKVIQLHEAGHSLGVIARELDCAKSSVEYIVNKHTEAQAQAGGVAVAVAEAEAAPVETEAPPESGNPKRYVFRRGSHMAHNFKIGPQESHERIWMPFTPEEFKKRCGMNLALLIERGDIIEFVTLGEKQPKPAAPVEEKPDTSQATDRFKILDGTGELQRVAAQCGDTITRRELLMVGYCNKRSWALDKATPISALIRDRKLWCESETAPEYELNPPSVEECVRSLVECCTPDGAGAVNAIRLLKDARRDTIGIPGRRLCPERDDVFVREIERQMKALLPTLDEAALEVIAPLADSRNNEDAKFGMEAIRLFIAKNRIRSHQLQSLAVTLAQSGYRDRQHVGVAMLAVAPATELGFIALSDIASLPLTTQDELKSRGVAGFGNAITKEETELRRAAQRALWRVYIAPATAAAQIGK